MSVRVNGELTNRGQRSRAGLVAAARTIFERDGFQNARITDISKLAGMADGRLDPSIDPHYAATALTSMVGGFARTWFITGEEFELDRAVTQLTKLWINAVGLDEPKSLQ